MNKRELVRLLGPILKESIKQAVQKELKKQLREEILSSDILKTIIHEVAATAIGAALINESRRPVTTAPRQHYIEEEGYDFAPIRAPSRGHAKPSYEKAFKEFMQPTKQELLEARDEYEKKRKQLGNKLSNVFNGVNPFEGTKAIEEEEIDDLLFEEVQKAASPRFVSTEESSVRIISDPRKFNGQEIHNGPKDAFEASGLDPNDPGLPLSAIPGLGRRMKRGG